MKTVTILSFSADGTREPLVTDGIPRFSFSYEGEMTGAELTVGDRTVDASGQVGIDCPLTELEPFTNYEAILRAYNDEESDEQRFSFQTGRRDTPWQGKWITDGTYVFKKKKVSPRIMVFHRRIQVEKPIARAQILATALGVYELSLNGEKVGDQYLAPGFTSYKHDLQYQTYDVTHQLQEENSLIAEVAGGWAVGSFVFTRANRITADRQALLLELRITYTDGTTQVIGTDESWEVTTKGPLKAADLYDGEIYDARIDPEKLTYHPASLEKVTLNPRITAQIGLPVRRHEKLVPTLLHKVKGKLIYDFGQNFAGVVTLRLCGKDGQQIRIRHAEILTSEGDLNTAFLNSAKATLKYTCRDGWQEYTPRFTYMGFRYISVEGAGEEELEISARPLHSDLQDNGSFNCSEPMLNRLNENIRWGARSNFVEIPTDCPQRDERMGWTGDIAVFAPTAAYNFDMSRFLSKWLRDLRSEQNRSGGFPNTIPSQSYGFPNTMPNMAVDFWDDACILVPWAIYMASGDPRILEESYESMERYVKACKFWANLVGFGKQRYLWHTPSTFHFGDWVAPDVPKMSQWQKRSKWTATASLCNSAAMLARISELLGKNEKAEKYRKLSRKVADAYQSLLMDETGKLKKEEFQTGYVLPLYFHMLDEKTAAGAAAHLARLVEKQDYCIGTGFPGTPYILFALMDYGYGDLAYRMLLNTKCPSWLYEVKTGATTIWERWDALNEQGECPIANDGTNGMISYNHYASGAVGDFLYRRVAGIEAESAGYRTFRIQPMPGGGLTWVKAHVMSPYGKIAAEWHQEEDQFTIRVQVPAGTTCTLCLPNGNRQMLTQGVHEYTLMKEGKFL